MNRVRVIIIFILISLLLTLLSGFYQRLSNEIVQWGTECSPEYWFHCYHPNLSGGFPFAFIFDSTATSVFNSLGFEDNFRWVPFMMDMWIYFLMLVFSYKALLIWKVKS